jgi:hypothetical protein
MINELSPIDALKGVFELTVIEILKKGSYHGLPGFTLLRNKTNSDPTLSTIKKAYLNALINISLNQFYKLADSVLNYNQYIQLNGPKADIKTPGDITKILEQVSGLLNEMNKTYNTQLTATDTQITNYIKNTIINDLRKNLNKDPSIIDKLTSADVKELINYLDIYNNILSFNKFTFHINTEKTKSFGFLDKYENKSIITNGYISDSKNSFTNEDFSKLIELDNYTLLIHPEWWDNEDFIFGNESSKKLLLNSLRFEEIYNKSLKEILNIDKNE